MAVKTSENSPIRVNFLPRFGMPGGIGMTLAPGKHQDDAITGVWRRDLRTDLSRLADHFGTDVLVCLLRSSELAELRIKELAHLAWAHGIEFWHFPISDGGAPGDLLATRRLVSRIVFEARRGRRVVIHCKGGLGRTGTIAACCVCALRPGRDATRVVRTARSGAVETDVQRAFIEKYASKMVSGILPDGSVDHLSWRSGSLGRVAAWVPARRRFSCEEFELIRKGHDPQEMEDKWFIYWQSPWIHFHRSWTGNRIYQARIVRGPRGWELIGFWACRDRSRYKFISDAQDTREMLWLIDNLLLGRHAPFPDLPSAGRLESSLAAWSAAGQAAEDRSRTSAEATVRSMFQVLQCLRDSGPPLNRDEILDATGLDPRVWDELIVLILKTMPVREEIRGGEVFYRVEEAAGDWKV